MICKNCGSTLCEGAVFCGECGAKAEESVMFCPDCGARLPVGAEFCGQCGKRLAPKEEPKPKRKKKKGHAVLIIVIITVALAVCAAAIVGVYYFKSRADEAEDALREAERTERLERRREKSAAEEAEATAEAEAYIEKTPEEALEEDYLFPSDRVYITAQDLKDKTREEVALIRNEIFARHGYIFQTKEYADYFSAKAWYEPDPYFDMSMFNTVENANKDFLVEYEKSKGWR